MTLKENIYSRNAVPFDVDGLMSYFEEGGFHFSWVVEAGCHSATDTLRLAKYSQFKMFLLFEPDPVSYQKAIVNLSSLATSRYIIKQAAIADKAASFNLISDGALGGEGSLITEKNGRVGSERVEAVTLDSVIDMGKVRDGLLWLDVEGFAHPALIGGFNTLDLILAAKIEVEFANMNEYRKSNFKKIIYLMLKKGFVLKKANLNPCYFGDLLFVHKSKLKKTELFTGFLFRCVVLFMHGFLYRISRKPGY